MQIQDYYLQHNDTIAALATAQGVGAIAVIRVSGKDALLVCEKIFKGKKLSEQASHTAHFGTIRNADGKIIDEVLITIFKAPHSFTGENVAEIACHGSPFIVQQILTLLLSHQVRLAKAGEFTQRAFLNGKFDLAQAEAIADLIAASNATAHQAALSQLRGGFSQQINQLRDRLIHFAAMIELELDFGEEDVEFASRHALNELCNEILAAVEPLIQSFAWGNVVKNGVPVAIVGKPNAGKSTLLNTLLQEEKAIVSEIAGTTRDFIEDELVIEGISFRLIDTAGLRHTTDTIEAIGVERSLKKMQEASVILYLFDATTTSPEEALTTLQQTTESYQATVVAVANKIDKLTAKFTLDYPYFVGISAAHQTHIEDLKKLLLQVVEEKKYGTGDTIVTNMRHYDCLLQTKSYIQKVQEGIKNQLTQDWLAFDLKQAMYHLGAITGHIDVDKDILGTIFGKFCIGK